MGGVVGTSGRAVRATGLLVGFYAMGFGILALLLVVDVVLADLDTPTAILYKVLAASLLVAVPIVRGIFFTRGNRIRKPLGVVVTPAQEPTLWQRVGELAHQVGTRPPGEIRLTADVNAAVHESSYLLGLLPGKRRMFVGVPLLIGLSPAQLDAVIAHELGHYSNQDTRLAGLVHRGRASVMNTLRLYSKTTGSGGFMFGLYKQYAELYLRTTQAISREQELAADLLAARVAGRDNAACALRQLPALEAGFDFYLDRYASVGHAIGLLPTADEFLGGFRHLLADPDRASELDALRVELPDREASPYDSHPPLAERVAAIESLPEDPRGRDSGSAAVLLRDPAQVFAAVARAYWKPENRTRQQVDWATLVHAAGRARALDQAAPLLAAAGTCTGMTGSLPLVLDLIDSGRLDELAAQLPEPEIAKGTSGRLRAQHLRTALAARLTALVQVTLADQGRGGWPLSWARAGNFVSAESGEAIVRGVGAAIALTPSTAPLRELMGWSAGLHQ